jgi:hypothetical protein
VTFAGLPDNVFYGLLAGAVGVVTVLYLLKLRRRRVLVPYGPLWARILEQRAATSLLQKLKRFISWMLALVFAALLVFSLADPRIGAEMVEQKRTAILIDASASMQSRDEKPTRLARAKEEARALVRALGAEERAMVVELGAKARPLGTFTNDKDSLLAAIDAVRASDTKADLSRAIDTLAASFEGRAHTRIVVLSDGKLPEVAGKPALRSTTIEGVRLGTAGESVGITSFNVRRYLASPGEYEAFLEIRNFSNRRTTCDVTLSVVTTKACKQHRDCTSGFDCDALLGVCANPQGTIPPIRLEPRGVWRRVLPNLQSDGGRLVATVEPRDFADVFPLDNRAYAYLPPRRSARIQLVTAHNLFLEALLLLDPQNIVTKVNPGDWKPDADYDLVIFDGVAPDIAKRPGNYVYIRPSGSHAPVEIGGEPVRAPAVATLKSQHPVLRWVALKDLNILESDDVRPRAEDTTIVFGVGKGGRDAPLLLARETAAGKTLVFTFDLRKSDLPLRWSFPILVPNIVAWMKGESREENSSYVTGERFSVPVPRRVDRVVVVDPDGVRREAPVRDGFAQFVGTRAGFYELYAPAPDTTAEPITIVAANLQDVGESDIAPAPNLTLLGKAAAAVTRAEIVERDLWVYLLFFALALTLVEWLTYHRRITV